MSVLTRLVTSSLGKKYLMALTGAGLFLFVIGHMLGNLQFFLGAEAINRYAKFLQSTPEILWPTRVGLLAIVIIHIWTSLALTIENRQARGTAYEVKELVAASLASRTMLVGGVIVFCFIAFHLAHYTLMTVQPELRNLHDAAGRHDVHRMMIVSFSNGWISTFYILGVGLLCLHLSHGVGSMFQSLGLKNETWRVRIDRCGIVAAVALFVGYVSIPVAVLSGAVR
jgi:succinate dehydrogenase / fumarate reductase cytochrome b subunit